MAHANAYVIRNPASFQVDEVEYKNQVSKVRLVPDTPTQTMRTWGGVDKDRDSTSWVVEITMHQDFKTGGLAKAIWDAAAAGTNVEIVVQPKGGVGNPTMTCTVVPVPPDFGGEAGEWATSELTLEVVDQPVLGAAA